MLIYIYIYTYVCVFKYIHTHKYILIYGTNIWFVFFYHYNVQSHIPNVRWLHPGPSPSLPRFPKRPIDQGTICRQMYAAERSTWQNQTTIAWDPIIVVSWSNVGCLRSGKPKAEEAYFVSIVSNPCKKTVGILVSQSGSLKHSHFSLGTLVGSLPLKAPPPWAPQPP